MKWGTTFSTKYCRELGLDPVATLNKILVDFSFNTLRICAYWDELELKDNEFDYQWLDQIIQITSTAKTEVVLALGRKVPRWPEFHEPNWALDQDRKFLEEKTLEYIAKVVDRYKSVETISAWQVENEPLYDFGKSEYKLTKKQLEKEIQVVRSIDNRPIILTDSGEWGDLRATADFADILGINVYTTSYNSQTKTYNTNNFPPEYYKTKLRKINTPVLIAELQAEPWGPKHNAGDLDIEEAFKSMNTEKLLKNIELARAIDIREIWFWGVEWWYLIADKGYPELLSTVKKLVKEEKFWVGISGSWRKTSKQVESDVRRYVRDVIKRGGGIVTGGALQVDYFATDEALKIDPKAEHIKVYLPATLERYSAHYRKRAKEGVITSQQAEELIEQLHKLKHAKASALVENMDNEKIDTTEYYARNTEVVNASDSLVAFWVNKSQGVKDTIDKARTRNINVDIHEYKL